MLQIDLSAYPSDRSIFIGSLIFFRCVFLLFCYSDYENHLSFLTGFLCPPISMFLLPIYLFVPFNIFSKHHHKGNRKRKRPTRKDSEEFPELLLLLPPVSEKARWKKKKSWKEEVRWKRWWCGERKSQKKKASQTPVLMEFLKSWLAIKLMDFLVCEQLSERGWGWRTK